MGVGGQCCALATLPQKRPGTHCVGGQVGCKDGPDAYRKSHPHQDSIPGPSRLASRYTDRVIPARTLVNITVLLSATGVLVLLSCSTMSGRKH
jgi:hypothetical protein